MSVLITPYYVLILINMLLGRSLSWPWMARFDDDGACQGARRLILRKAKSSPGRPESSWISSLKNTPSRRSPSSSCDDATTHQSPSPQVSPWVSQEEISCQDPTSRETSPRRPSSAPVLHQQSSPLTNSPDRPSSAPPVIRQTLSRNPILQELTRRATSLDLTQERDEQLVSSLKPEGSMDSKTTPWTSPRRDPRDGHRFLYPATTQLCTNQNW